MEKGKHTQGKCWTPIISTNDAGEMTSDIIDKNNGNITIASDISNIKHSHLIASAPLMLEVLKRLFKEEEERAEMLALSCDLGVSEWESCLSPDGYNFQQIINKAEGKGE